MTKKALIGIILTAVLSASIAAGPQSPTAPGRTRLSFRPSGQALEPGIGRGVALGDFNGDGNADAFVVNQAESGQDISVYVGDGTGRFTEGPKLQNAGLAVQPAVLDVDGDRDLDVLTGRTVWLNDGHGAFTADATRFQDADGAVLRVCLPCDLNKDGRIDVFAVTFVAKGMDPRGFPNVDTKGRVYFGDGTGRFKHNGREIGQGVLSAAALGDVDGDGDTDAVFSGWRNVESDPCPNRVFLNDGQGGFTDSGQVFDEALRHSHSLALGDLDKDGDLDFVLATQAAPFARLYLNDGKGRFTAGPTLGTVAAEKVAVADLDGDGALDVFLACIGPNEAWLNDGRGGFSDSGLRLGSEWTWEIAVGDLNGDRRPDLVLVDMGVDRKAAPGQALKPLPAEVWINVGLNRR